MTVEKFQSIRFQARTSETIKRANEIIAEYDARVLTLLQQSRELLKTIGLAGAPPGSVARSRPDQGSLAERYPREWRAERRPANGNAGPGESTIRCAMRAETLAKTLGGRKAGFAWMAHCPAHEDRAPSFASRLVSRD
jgi:hypothetical protein